MKINVFSIKHRIIGFYNLIIEFFKMMYDIGLGRATVARSEVIAMKERRNTGLRTEITAHFDQEQLQEHLQPMPEHDYFEFFSNDTSLYPHMYARTYINFKNQEDIILFRDRFDGYVFLDNKGQEYPGIEEFAPFRKAVKKKTKKRDTKVGTTDGDPEYRKFLESYAADNEKMTSTPETLLEEIEAKNREAIDMHCSFQARSVTRRLI
uniref:UPF3 domain-containing protein n=1 Tax=Moschus moschiferus TaxID=68415 RepID=A0A8C6CND3_MOSMO